MAKKPSFFEKLTGATWSNDDKNEPEGLNIESLKEEVAKPIKEKPVPKEKKVAPEPTKKPLAPVSPKKENEDWLAESEGQLTIDVYQTPNDIVIKSTIAGVQPENIDITMSNDMITIKGKRKKDEEVSEEDYYYQECYWGPFSRSVILPVDVEVDRAKASMKNGILTIRLPKIEKVKTKKISISAE